MELLRSTTTPPAGAGASKVMVAVDVRPPATDVGDSATDIGAGPRTTSDVVTVTPLFVALSVAVEFAAIAAVDTVNVADVAPAATVTEVGSVAAARFDVRLTTRPPFGAGPVSVTVPVTDAPPKTVVGETEILETAGATTVNVTDLLTEPRVAVIATSVSVATADETAFTFTLVAPAGTVACTGKLMMPEFALVKVTVVPPVGAAPSS
jgi:hypothetical protein